MLQENYSPSKGPFFWDLLGFLASLAIAWIFHWQAKDLVWSLWLSSLIAGILITIWIFIFRRENYSKLDDASFSLYRFIIVLSKGVCMFVVYTAFFGGFLLVDSIFLNYFYPIESSNHEIFLEWPFYFQVIKNYWPFVLITIATEFKELKTLKNSKPFMMIKPYLNIIRMHLLIFFIAGITLIKLNSFYVYAAASFLYFFPFFHVVHLFKSRS
jgi:hypothetical protein